MTFAQAAQVTASGSLTSEQTAHAVLEDIPGDAVVPNVLRAVLEGLFDWDAL